MAGNCKTNPQIVKETLEAWLARTKEENTRLTG